MRRLKKQQLHNIINELDFKKNKLRTGNNETQLTEVTTLMERLNAFEEQDWKDSCAHLNNTNNYCSVNMSYDENYQPCLLELTGDNATQEATLTTLKAAYKKITGRETETKTYPNAESLPDNLKKELSHKEFPMKVVSFELTDARQFQAFNKVLAPLIAEGKVTELTAKSDLNLK